MELISNCRNCGAVISRVSLEAFVPSCDHCGTPVMELGGALGITSAYGKTDLTLKRALLEKQLDVYRDHQRKYEGLIAASREQLTWGPERYAKLPQEPEFLPLEPVPTIEEVLRSGLALGCGFMPVVFIGIMIKFSTGVMAFRLPGWPFWLALLSWVPAIAIQLFLRQAVISRNGDKPRENQRRQAAHDEAVRVALVKGDAVKKAEDHKLRKTIVDAEGKLKTIVRQQAEVAAMLAAVIS